MGNDTTKQNSSVNPKKLTFLSIYFLGINGIIGSGAFLLPQAIYKDMALMSVFVLICAAITISMIALCYADLSSRFSGSGAAWLYSYNAFGRFTGFQVGLFSWFLGSCTVAAEVVALLRTLKNISPAFQKDQVYYGTAIGLVILLAIVNLFGTGIVKWVDNISSVAKMFTIIFFIVVGIFFMHKANFSPVVPKEVTGAGSFFSHFGSAFSVVFYMFTGFSFIPVAAGQMNNPEKNIPKALITVMISVTVLYALVQSIAIGILGPTIVHYDIPIAHALLKAVGEWGYYLVVIGMLISIFGVAFAVSFNTPVLAASLANEHNLLPKFLGKHNRFGAPYIAVIVTAVISGILIMGNYLFLVSCLVLASFIQYVPSIFAVIKFKHNKQFPNHGFSLKGGYVIPILALIISCYLLTNFNLPVFLVSIAVFVVGVIIYFTTIKKLDEPDLVKKTKLALNPSLTATDSTEEAKIKNAALEKKDL